MNRISRNICRRILAVALTVMALCVAFPAEAQRRITPVDNPATAIKKKETKKEFDRSRLAERLDANGNVILVDTVAGTEFVDSTLITPVVGNIYPLWHAVTVGVDFIDPILRAFGQQYGGLGFWGELSLHNRYKPIFEAGLSSASITPDGMNFTFKSPLAPYFKLGMNYNVFYNSNPDYQLCVGIRYGFSPFKFTVADVTTSDGNYWGDTTPVDFPSQSTTASYLEFVMSIKVKIIKDISLGWALRYHNAYGGKTDIGESMYIPGFGKRANKLAIGFNIMYTLPLNKKAPKIVHDSSEPN